MADDQVLLAWRGVPIKGFVDFAVGGIDTHLKHLDFNGPTLRHMAHMRMRLIGELRLRNVTQMHTMRLTRYDGDGFHGDVFIARRRSLDFINAWKCRS